MNPGITPIQRRRVAWLREGNSESHRELKMEKTVTVKCRVMFGQNVLHQERPVEGEISVKADGSDTVQDLKSKVAVRRSHIILFYEGAQNPRQLRPPCKHSGYHHPETFDIR